MKEPYLPHQSMMCVTGTSKSAESGFLQGWLAVMENMLFQVLMALS